MLSANTIGPGTVVVCARAGTEYGLSLLWTLVFATGLSYTLQECSARLTIVSGKSLGQCLQIQFDESCKIYGCPWICWLVGVSVFVGNLLYECNNFAGGVMAVMALPPASSSTLWMKDWIVIWSSLVYGMLIVLILSLSNTKSIGIMLGLATITMALLFLILVTTMGVPWIDLCKGLLPSIPSQQSQTAADPSAIALSLVGTTLIGFNIFLTGAMATGRSLSSTRRGIAISHSATFLVSALILLSANGSVQHSNNSSMLESNDFTVSHLSDAIKKHFGDWACFVFAFGFIAAALSSMLTVPLGAAITAESVWVQPLSMSRYAEQASVRSQSAGQSTPASDHPRLGPSLGPVMGPSLTGESKSTGDFSVGPSQSCNSSSRTLSHNSIARSHSHCSTIHTASRQSNRKSLPGVVYWGIICIIVLAAATVAVAGVPRSSVILVAQVFNGLLLPFFAICLVVCVNDSRFMASQPQALHANLSLLGSVAVTLFLAANLLLHQCLNILMKAFPSLGDRQPLHNHIQVIASAAVALVIIVALCVCSSVRQQLNESLRRWRIWRSTS